MDSITDDANIIKTVETDNIVVITTDNICHHHLFLEMFEQGYEICPKCGSIRRIVNDSYYYSMS